MQDIDHLKSLAALDKFPSGPPDALALDSLSHLVAVYPGFEEWISKKVQPGLRDGSRKIFLRVYAGRAVGVAIAKKAPDERKLCTLWVAPEARASGIASDLAEEAFEWLGDRRPLFTVPDVRFHEFRGLIGRWGFSLDEVVAGLYRRGSREYVFNGCLRRCS